MLVSCTYIYSVDIIIFVLMKPEVMFALKVQMKMSGSFHRIYIDIFF